MEVTATIETVRVRFKRPCQAYRPGQVIDVTLGQARTLEMYGQAEIVREPQLELAVAPEPAVERAVAPAAKAPRRRRKLP